VIGLASESERAVPYRAIQEDPERFIDGQYIPQNIVFKEAKNMQKEDIHRFIDHIISRQKKFGVENAFRFRIYLKKNKEHFSEYPEAAGRRKKKARKDKGKSNLNDQTHDAIEGDDGAANGAANNAANGAANADGTAKTRIAGPSTQVPYLNTNQEDDQESVPIISNHASPEEDNIMAANDAAAVNTGYNARSKKNPKTKKGKEKNTENPKTKKGKEKNTATAKITVTANITAAEYQNPVEGTKPSNTRRSKRNLQPKVPKSDALAILEAKKFVQQNSKRRR